MKTTPVICLILFALVAACSKSPTASEPASPPLSGTWDWFPEEYPQHRLQFLADGRGFITRGDGSKVEITHRLASGSKYIIELVEKDERFTFVLGQDGRTAVITPGEATLKRLD